jgi:hypothetical protein
MAGQGDKTLPWQLSTIISPMYSDFVFTFASYAIEFKKYAYLLNQIKVYLINRLLQFEDEKILGTIQGWNKSYIFWIIDESCV